MGSEWAIYTIDDTCYVTDGAHSKVDRQSEGVFYLTSKNIDVGNLILDKVDYISREDYERLFSNTAKAQRRPCDGDILIGIIGTFGNAYRYKKKDLFGISSAIAIIRPNPEILNSDFLYYIVTSATFKAIHASYKSGSAQGYTNIPTIKLLPLPVPPLPEQKAIAHILGSLDERIELNRRMNETLEGMAQALFKSWFVDFDPVLDNALASGKEIPPELKEKAAARTALANKAPLPKEIRTLFPDEFSYSDELGWIPKGWEVASLGDISFVKGGYAFKGKDFTTSGCPVIKIKNINSDKTINVHDVQYIPQDIASKAEKFWLSSGDLLMAMTGATVGKFGLLTPKVGETYLLNQRVAKFHPIDTVSPKTWFVYSCINQKKIIEHIVNIAHGSAQPNISAGAIMDTVISKPDNELIRLYDNMVDGNFSKILSNGKVIQILSKLRDTLLPKLLSGEIRIPDAEKMVEELG